MNINVSSENLDYEKILWISVYTKFCDVHDQEGCVQEANYALEKYRKKFKNKELKK